MNNNYYVTIEQLEKALDDSGIFDEYPKYHENGLYEVSKGCFVTEDELELFDEEFENEFECN